MLKHIGELLDNRKPIPEAGSRLGNDAYNALFSDLQPNIVSSHGFDRAQYFFVQFHRAESIVTRYLLGMLAHNGFERTLLRNTVTDPVAQEFMSDAFRTLVKTWKKDEPGGVSAEEHKLLADLRVVSEYESYWRRKGERERRARAQQGVASGAVNPARVGPRFTVNVLLTPAGYDRLGIAPPTDQAFRDGMPKRPLKDPKVEDWEHSKDWPNVEALFVIAYDPAADGEDDQRQTDQIAAFRKVVSAHANILFEEVGQALRSPSAGYPIEPFGFRDGISQPAFYESHRDYLVGQRRELAWDPWAPLRLVLSPDPHGHTRYACGTYFVFRKLEQDVEKFIRQSQRLVDDPSRESRGWKPYELQERFLGRTRTGDPLLPKGASPETQNDFDFKDDPLGEVCPFHAHVRKVNPRGDAPPSYDAQSHRIARRSLPYGAGATIKRDNHDAPVLASSEDDAPRPSVGLLFMCAQADIARQFEHLQAHWANKPDHPRGRRTAVDTVIGQLSPGQKNLLAIDEKGRPLTAGLTDEYDPVVTLKGGAYFFAPSISFLRGLLTDLIRVDLAQNART